MSKKRIMVMGPRGCGKTTLVNYINGYEGPLRKTQDLLYGENTMDVPGAYIEIPWMYKHAIVAAQDAYIILMLVDQTNCKEIYSPGFARVFNCPVLGVITKSELKPENEELCKKQLKKIGVLEPYYKIDCHSGLGLDALKEAIKNLKK